MRQGRGLQGGAERASSAAVLEIFVYGTVESVRAGLGHDVHDSTRAPAVFRAEAVIHHAKFLYRFLRGSDALHAGVHADEIRAVHHDFIAERPHAAEGNLGRFKIRESGSQAGAAGGHAGREQGEIGEQAPADRESLDLLRLERLG